MILHNESKSILLQAPDPFQLQDLLPKSRMIDIPGFAYNIAVKHTLESVKVLRNIGIDAPAPIRTQYAWPGKYTPMSQQYSMAEFMTMNPRCFNLSDPGTGKTASTLWAADWLMAQGYVRKALILAPLSTLERIWMNDLWDVLMHRIGAVVHGTVEQRLKALSTNADFYIMNHDGVKIGEIANVIRRRPDIDLVVVDEGSKFRNASTKDGSCYRSLEKILRPTMKLWWLTGTPCPNGPTDAWAQARLINKSLVPEYFGTFKRKTMYQISQFKWVPKPESYKIAYEAMQPAIRFLKKDCMDLPPVVTRDRQAELTKEQRAAFKVMKATMQAEVASGVEVTAVNAADKINKLRQILLGSIKREDEYIALPHAPRLKVLLEIIEEASAKVIVIVPFKGIIRELVTEVSKHYPTAVLNGDVPIGIRNKILKAFKDEADPHILLCHPEVMAHGLNLTEADTMAFYGPIYSADQYQQVLERFNRAGQTRKMTVNRIGAHPLEWDIYKVVDTRGITQHNILNLYRTIIE